ncbi:MAG: low affinity iron permease family protein [Trebonia sp.]
MAKLAPSHGSSRSLVSLLLSGADKYASRPAAAVLVVTGAVVWLAVSIAIGFPSRWETVFQTVVAAITLAMVFVIQHTQARHQRATQRKLDEILLVIPGTDDSLLTLEHASDDELHALGRQHLSIREARLRDEEEATPRSDDARLVPGRPGRSEEPAARHPP